MITDTIDSPIALRSNALRFRAITHPIIAALRAAGYTVALVDEVDGVALRVIRADIDLVVRAATAGAALDWVGLWLQSKCKESADAMPVL